ncbi:transcriptional regulator swi6 [Xylographa opegraphella]|nr:transcriptional regulator swi6 [Xylographa opegraphella]
MALAIQAAQYPTPAYSRDSTGSSIGGNQLMNGDVIPFSGSHSVASTPTQTPPPSRGQQQPMSFSMSSYGPMGPIHMQQGPPRGYTDVNGNMSQHQYVPVQKPQIYTAVYSGVQVYEMEVNRVAVMRRRHDSWLNATQILKVAGIEKGKRTKVLEKEILAGEHEKVQGGYGKYQGTWINYRRGREFCQQYGVEELLRPLLEYDMGQDGVTQAGQGAQETPTKEQAMAAQRKKMMYNGGVENRPPAQSPNGTFFQKISASAASAVNAINKARFDSPGPRPGSGNKRPAPPVKRPSQQMLGSQESAFPGSSQQSMESLHMDGSFGINGQLEPAFGAHATPYFTNPQLQNSDMQEPPRKRPRPSSSHDTYVQEINGGYDRSMRDITPTEPNESFLYAPQNHMEANMDYTIVGLPPLPQPSSKSAKDKAGLLLSLFKHPSRGEFFDHETLQQLSGDDLDIPIDASANTALHWASALAKTSLLRLLIAKGANMFRVNGGSENGLIRAAITTNNHEAGTFAELLELLGPTIEMRDGRGRTVLHHIALASAVKGRSPCCRYYLESLLEFVVRQGSSANSQQNSFNGPSDPMPKPKSIGLARFLSEIVNATDLSGDTALNLAARIGNKSIIQQLLEVGADPTIANRGGLKPTDFGVGGDPEPLDAQQSSSQTLPVQGRSAIAKVGDSSRDLMSSITALLSDTETSFRTEVQSKQARIDQTHAKLRETSILLSDEKRRLEDLQRKVDKRKEMQQRVTNLRRVNEEQKMQLTRSGSNGSNKIRLDVKIGDADAGLNIDVASLPSTSGSEPFQVPPQQHAYLSSLERVEVLRARVTAYQAHNAGLEEYTAQMKSRSVEMEKKLRRVVALCTHVDESKLDTLIDGLITAVEGEKGQNLEVGRVREFLRKVEGVEV